MCRNVSNRQVPPSCGLLKQNEPRHYRAVAEPRLVRERKSVADGLRAPVGDAGHFVADFVFGFAAGVELPRADAALDKDDVAVVQGLQLRVIDELEGAAVFVFPVGIGAVDDVPRFVAGVVVDDAAKIAVRRDRNRTAWVIPRGSWRRRSWPPRRSHPCRACRHGRAATRTARHARQSISTRRLPAAESGPASPQTAFLRPNQTASCSGSSVPARPVGRKRWARSRSQIARTRAQVTRFRNQIVRLRAGWRRIAEARRRTKRLRASWQRPRVARRKRRRTGARRDLRRRRWRPCSTARIGRRSQLRLWIRHAGRDDDPGRRLIHRRRPAVRSNPDCSGIRRVRGSNNRRAQVWRFRTRRGTSSAWTSWVRSLRSVGTGTTGNRSRAGY